MGRFVSATGQFLLATNGQFSRPPAGSSRCPLTLVAMIFVEPSCPRRGLQDSHKPWINRSGSGHLAF